MGWRKGEKETDDWVWGRVCFVQISDLEIRRAKGRSLMRREEEEEEEREKASSMVSSLVPSLHLLVSLPHLTLLLSLDPSTHPPAASSHPPRPHQHHRHHLPNTHLPRLNLPPSFPTPPRHPLRRCLLQYHQPRPHTLHLSRSSPFERELREDVETGNSVQSWISWSGRRVVGVQRSVRGSAASCEG